MVEELPNRREPIKSIDPCAETLGAVKAPPLHVKLPPAEIAPLTVAETELASIISPSADRDPPTITSLPVMLIDCKELLREGTLTAPKPALKVRVGLEPLKVVDPVKVIAPPKELIAMLLLSKLQGGVMEIGPPAEFMLVGDVLVKETAFALAT